MTQDSYHVLILGYGEMGHAMAYWLRPRHDVTIWQRTPKTGASLDLAGAATHAEFILFCVPAAAHGELSLRLKPRLRRETLCVSIAKGLDDQGRTAEEIFGEILGVDSTYGVLYGPMISEEIRAGRPAFAEFSSRAPGAGQRLRQLFAGVPLALDVSNDVTGSSWCAVLKNAYAILFGVADGLGLGDNTRGYLAVAALREITDIITSLGGDPATAASFAGLGDLITTATSAGSHHHALGIKLARGEATTLAGEGVHTLLTLVARRPFDPEPYPLLQLAQAIVVNPGKTRLLVEQRMELLFQGG